MQLLQQDRIRKPELLAPAGSYEGMIGAINAGADAVYFGGSLFSARAFAQNFSTEEASDAIRYAALHGVKTYLTINTLVKEQELGDLIPFLTPYVRAGLNGVIVQDLGVLALVQENFPELELHASTQMAISGKYGALLLKRLGCVRVVPARELSLTELKIMKEGSGVDLEAFIHGAMCYCYSGLCLFSSIIGGRSGNRGRCAQSCRLPYHLAETSEAGRSKEKSGYLLSLKDLCALPLLPELMEAGIDSFKIEGRMKKPEYTAGVTAIYRKYIDLYLEDPASFHVAKEDLSRLSSLYMRSQIETGYYHRHNGREMVTLSQPGYSGSSETLLKEIRDLYLTGKKTIPVQMTARLIIGKPAELILKTVANEHSLRAMDEVSASVRGEEVQEARKAPLQEEQVIRSLKKLGGTNFHCISCTVEGLTENRTGVFLPSAALNELRRRAIASLEEKILLQKDNPTLPVERKEVPLPSFHAGNEIVRKANLHVSVESEEQLSALMRSSLKADRISIGVLPLLQNPSLIQNIRSFYKEPPQIFAALPFMTREETEVDLKDLDFLLQLPIDGFVIRNLEELAYLLAKEEKEAGQRKRMLLADASLYCWNHRAVLALPVDAFTLPLELSFHDWGRMLAALREFELREFELREFESREFESREFERKSNFPKRSYEIPVYGNAPMMVSANCVKKTVSGCSGKRGECYREQIFMKDRTDRQLPVTCECRYCYNIIENALPTSLHKQLFAIRKSFPDAGLRLAFTGEREDECERVCRLFHEIESGREPSSGEETFAYTTGRYRKSTE